MPSKSSTPSALSTERVESRRIYVLDTNVLMHDPAALFRFDEHDIYLPMVVLEELDHHKKGAGETARNVRQVSRFLDEIMQDADKAEIDGGLPIPTALSGNGNGKGGKGPPTGKLFFQTRNLKGKLPDELPGTAADNAILAQTLALQAESPRIRVTLVSKDINLRIKAAILGIHAEDYFSDRTIDDADLLDSGTRAVADDFWQRHGQNMRSWKEGGRTLYEVQGPDVADWQVNQFVYEQSESGIEAMEQSIDGDTARLRLIQDYRSPKHSVWGIAARNREQNFALNLLLDPDVDLVTILGPAGTGKTLLTLAAGLTQTLDASLFVEIIMTRVTIPLGEDIGFLPGTEEEKMEPWMGRADGQPRGAHAERRGRQLGPRRHQRPAAQSHQDPLAQLHARAHLHEPLRDHRRGAEPHAQADEGAADPRRPGHEDGLPRQHRADRHALPHRDTSGLTYVVNRSAAGPMAGISRCAGASARGWPMRRPKSCDLLTAPPRGGFRNLMDRGRQAVV